MVLETCYSIPDFRGDWILDSNIRNMSDEEPPSGNAE